MFSQRTPIELPKHVHFRLTLDDPTHAKRPSSFPEFDFRFTYILGFNLSDDLLYQIAVPLSIEPEQKSDYMALG